MATAYALNPPSKFVFDAYQFFDGYRGNSLRCLSFFDASPEQSGTDVSTNVIDSTNTITYIDVSLEGTFGSYRSGRGETIRERRDN